MRFFLVTILLCFITFDCYSDHIVGGEVRLIHIDSNTYRLELIQYFDEYQSSNPGPEASVEIYIFSNSSDTVVGQFEIPLIAILDVEVMNGCFNPEVSRVVYSGVITLDAATYNEPQGYYAVWERCCRNYGISNLENSEAVGIKYLLEFPAVVDDGVSFINSSPIIPAFAHRELCLGELFQFDLEVYDSDGDSLVYSLQLPLNASALVPIPTPQPKPHFSVMLEGDVENMIPGNPALHIDDRGVLKVSPTETGLFLYSLKVEEYREGKKIGAIFHDFEMSVIDNCQIEDRVPSLAIQLNGEPETTQDDSFVEIESNADRYIDIYIGNIGDYEPTIGVHPVNFEFDAPFNAAQSGFWFGSVKILSEDSVSYSLGFSKCLFTDEEPYVVAITIENNNCVLIQSDTIEIAVKGLPREAMNPKFWSAEGHGISADNIVLTGEDEKVFYMTLEEPLPYGEVFEIEAVNFEIDEESELLQDRFSIEKMYSDSVFYEISVPDCPILLEESYQVKMFISDARCLSYQDSVTMTINLIDELNNTSPIYDGFNNSDTVVNVNYDDILSQFDTNVIVSDPDGDSVVVEVLHVLKYFPNMEGFQMAQTYLSKDSVRINFNWRSCVGHISENESSVLTISAQDVEKCNSIPSLLFLDLMINERDKCNPLTILDNQSLEIGEIDLNHFVVEGADNLQNVVLRDLSGRLLLQEHVQFIDQEAVLKYSLQEGNIYLLTVGKGTIRFLYERRE